MIIGLCGKQNSGKDTVANYLEDKYDFFKYSLSNPLYETAIIFYPELFLNSTINNISETDKRRFKEYALNRNNYKGRNFLQNLGDVILDINKLYFCKSAQKKLKNNNVIPDIRLLHEYNWLRQIPNNLLIYIERDINQNDNHKTESYLDFLKSKADYILDNNQDIKDTLKDLDFIIENELRQN